MTPYHGHMCLNLKIEYRAVNEFSASFTIVQDFLFSE